MNEILKKSAAEQSKALKNKEISANTRFAKPRIRLSEIYKEISINKKFSRL